MNVFRDEQSEGPNVPIIPLWKDITHLTDVNSIYIYQIGEKKYFFFGDQHHSKSEGGCNLKCDDFESNFKDEKYFGSNCTSIGVLLHNWFIYNNDHDIKADFYLETAFITKDDRTEDELLNREIRDLQENNIIYHPLNLNKYSWMTLTRSLMQTCFIREKTKCPYYPNIHLHYADVRKLDAIHVDPFILFDIIEYLRKIRDINAKELIELKYELSIILSIISYDYLEIMNGILQPEEFQEFLDKYAKLSSGFSKSLGSKYLEKIKNMDKISVVRDGVKMHRTAGELWRLRQKTPYIANLIEEFIYGKAQYYIDEVKHILDKGIERMNEIELRLESRNLERYKVNVYFREIKSLFEIISTHLIPISALSMDAYLLARMFLQTDSKEIITYTGSAHTDHYAEFFGVFLGINPLLSFPRVLGNRCLAVMDLPKYLNANLYRTYVVKKQYNIK